MWQALDDIGTELRSAQEEFSKAREGHTRYMYGVEYRDIVDMRNEKAIKRVAISQVWVKLTKDHSIAIFGSKLGHPIKPVRPELICRPWQLVPSGKNHLVITCPVVQHFLTQGQKVFGANVKWKINGGLIHNHEFGRKSDVRHVQILQATRKLHPNNGLLSLVAKYPKGGFISNKHKSRDKKRCPEIVTSLVAAGPQISRLNDQEHMTKLNPIPDTPTIHANRDPEPTSNIDIGEGQSTDHRYSSFEEQSNESSTETDNSLNKI